MEKTLVKLGSDFILTFFAFLLLVSPSYASTTAGYIGGDLTQNQANQAENTLHITDTKYFSLSDADRLLHETTTGTILDSVAMQQQNSLSVKLVKNMSSTIDALGYTDFLLTLGVYNANVSVINNDQQYSLIESMQAYDDMTHTDNSSRINDFKTEFGIYQDLVKELKSVTKASKLLFDIESTSFADPDYGYATNPIVDISLGRNNVSISPALKDKLYTWTQTYIKDGNAWQGFFRYAFFYSQNGTVYTTYKELDSSPIQSPSDDTTKKLTAFIIFAAFLILLLYLVNRSKKQLS